MSSSANRRWVLIAWVAAAVLGLALRMLLGNGDLWLDEAWSVRLAEQAQGPIGVLAGIHHDNNHPLNSWWIQLVGGSSPPLAIRALSIVSSVLTIFVAARMASRRTAVAGAFTAFLFAVCPILVLLGSEARGYAPMLLALCWIIDRIDAEDHGEHATAPWQLAAASALGTLAHLAMLPALVLVAAWRLLSTGRPLKARVGPALSSTIPFLAASAAVVAVVVGTAIAVQGGLTIGSSTPFTWAGLADGLGDLIRMTLGAEWPVALLVVLGLLALKPAPAWRDGALWLCLGLGFPVAAAMIHPANAHIARYFLPSAVALLWLVGVRAAAVRPLWAGFAAMVGIVAASLVADARLIRDARGEPGRPVRRIAQDHPGAAIVLLPAERMIAPIELAARRGTTRITLVGPACARADYLLVDLERSTTPGATQYCGQTWELVEFRPPPYRGAIGWALYRITGLHGAQGVARGSPPAG